MSTTAVRLANASDLPALADLRWRLQNSDPEFADEKARERFISDFVTESARSDADLFHFAAERGAKIIGAMSVRSVRKVPAPDRLVAHWGYLTNCYVLPDFRNESVGSILLAYVTDWARSQGLEMLVVWPSERSYAFYERAGFRRERDPLVLELASED